MTRFSFPLFTGVVGTLCIALPLSVSAQSLPACLMSLAAPGVCLNEAIQCDAAAEQNYGTPVATLCARADSGEALAASAQDQLDSCVHDKNTQADSFNAALVSESAARINAFKALSRAKQKIRALRRRLLS